MDVKKRNIVIGDIHGCLDEFKELIQILQYDSSTDRLIVVGDLIDRGPDSVGVVRKCREMNLEVTKGNHEWKFLKWYKGNKHYDSAPHYSQLNDDDVAYINNMPFSIEIRPDLWVLHAGVKPYVPLAKQRRDDLMYLRYTDKERNFISLRKIAAGDVEGAIFWTGFGPFGANVIYGHNVHSYEDIRVDEFSDGTSCYGIDTGCCFGGRLTAFIVETGEVVQVQAKETYYKPGFK